MSAVNPTKSNVPVNAVAFWTLPWVLLILVLLVLGSFTHIKISYDVYTWFRRAAAVLLIALAIVGLLFALEKVGKDPKAPWYTNSLLVALVLFWGLCPPAWFFTEYYLIDMRALGLPPSVQISFDAAVGKKAQGDVVAAHLAATKTYADLASKIWVAVGAALASAITFARS